MIKSIDKVDFSKAKAHKRTSDSLEVTAVEMAEDFDIILPDKEEQVDHVRLESEVVVENGRKEVKVKEIHGKAKVIHAYGGTIRGKRGDYIVRAKDGFVFAVSNRVKASREAPETLFENTFEAI